MRCVGLQVQKFGYITHHGTEDGLVHRKAWRVAADAAAEFLAESPVLIAGSNEELVS